MNECDVAVVGAGPAGIECALMLARARRRVMLFDGGARRNAAVRAMHGMLALDGTSPNELIDAALAQLEPYGVELVRSKVHDASGNAEDGFVLESDAGALRARRIVLATGMRDKLPQIDGLEELWGTSVFVCPYCDGWEVRDRPIAALGNTRSGVGLAQELYQWSSDIVVCSDLRVPISPAEREWLARTDVRLKESPIRRLHGSDGQLERIEFDDGDTIDRHALFLCVELEQHSDLAERLGCRITADGRIDVDPQYRTSVPGCFAAGDAVTARHQVLFAAASGASAAMAINEELLQAFE